MKDIKASKHEGDKYQINDQSKWTGQELGVNSNIPLVDAGSGKPYVIRKFEFHFDPTVLQKIREKKVKFPSKQELFNTHWRQIQSTLWGDGLVARQDVEPNLMISKFKYIIVLACEPRFGTSVIERPNTLQEITPSPLQKKKR